MCLGYKLLKLHDNIIIKSHVCLIYIHICINYVINFALGEGWNGDHYVNHVYGVPKAMFPNVDVAEIQDLKGPLRDVSSLVVQRKRRDIVMRLSGYLLLSF